MKMGPSLPNIFMKGFAAKFSGSVQFNNLLDSIESAYNIFKKYPKPNELTCFDGLREDSKQISELVLYYDVRSIPDKQLRELEFFAEDESWGTTAEVKYLLPRMLEYIATDFVNAADNKTEPNFKYLLDHGFCQYKLCNINAWPENEMTAVLEIVYNLFDFLVHNCDNLNDFIVNFCPNFPLDGERFVKIWNNAPHERKSKQFPNFLNSIVSIHPCVLQDFSLGDVNITAWITQDKHILEFDFFNEDQYFQMIFKPKTGSK